MARPDDADSRQRSRPAQAHAAADLPEREREALLQQLRELRADLQALFTQAREHPGCEGCDRTLQRRLLGSVELALQLDERVLLPALRNAGAAPRRALGAAEIDIEVLRDLAALYRNQPERLCGSARMHLRTMDCLLRSPAAEHDIDWARARRDVTALIARFEREFAAHGDGDGEGREGGEGDDGREGDDRREGDESHDRQGGAARPPPG